MNLTFDLETTYGKSFKRAANMFDPENFKLCSSGWQFDNEEPKHSYFIKEDEEGYRTGGHNVDKDGLNKALRRKKVKRIIGCNLKFDMLWKWKEVRKAVKRGVKCWDIAYAQFLLSAQFYNNAQLPQFRPSLNNICKSFSLPTKHDIISEMWKEGIRTEDIDRDTLISYQDQDVRITKQSFDKQYKQAIRQGQLRMIESSMESLLATTEMEYNGLNIDMKEGLRITKELTEKLYKLDDRILSNYLPDNLPFDFNIGSSKQLSAFLFGGRIKYKRRDYIRDEEGKKTYTKVIAKWPLFGKQPVNPSECTTIEICSNELHVLTDGTLQDRTVSGKNKGAPKFKNVNVNGKVKKKYFDFYYTFDRVFEPKDKWKEKKPKDAVTNWQPEYWGTGDDNIKELISEYEDGFYLDMLKLIRKRRALAKDLGTYYMYTKKDGEVKGMLTLVQGGIIHHKLHHYITKTRRLSSSDPNLQNLSGKSRSMIKSVFTSRYGKKGRIVEIDYSQLEVVTKGVLSEDEQLLKDLANGVCFHCMNLSLSAKGEGKTYEEIYHLAKVLKDPKWSKLRSDIKPFTFQSKYGGGAALMAESTGLTIDQIKGIISKKKEVYPQETKFDDHVMDCAKKSREISPLYTENGARAGIGRYQCVTGTTYHFIERDAPKWMIDKFGTATSFSPTNTMNYPSQGLGGEIVQVISGVIFRYLLSLPISIRKKIKMVNTVHDSIYFDAHQDIIEANVVLPAIKLIMEDVVNIFQGIHGKDVITWTAAFPAEVDIGFNMMETPVSLLSDDTFSVSKKGCNTIKFKTFKKAEEYAYRV